MNLKKEQHFTLKEENKFVMSCFSLQTWKDSTTGSITFAAVQRFL